MSDAVNYLTAEDLVVIGTAATGQSAAVRDYGLLDAAASRPCASAFGRDAYSTIHDKAAALLQSVACNHALVDGNECTAWLASYVFYDINGYELDVSHDNESVELLLAVVSDHLDVAEIAAWLTSHVKPR